MAATIDLEVESGVVTQAFQPHHGYHAGDFGSRPVRVDLTYPRGPLVRVPERTAGRSSTHLSATAGGVAVPRHP